MTAAVALFVLTAGILWQTNRRTASPFLYSYALGLALLAAGLTGSMVIVVKDSPLQWVTRFSQALGYGLHVRGSADLVARNQCQGKSAGGSGGSLAGEGLSGRPRAADTLGLILRYVLAMAIVAAGMGLRLALAAWAGPGLPAYITFYPAVMVVALLAGFGPGLLATALADFVVATGFCRRSDSCHRLARGSPGAGDFHRHGLVHECSCRALSA